MSRPNRWIRSPPRPSSRIAQLGIWNSLAQLTIKIRAPGVPDLYQGSEIWDFSLVDPDNRRPVDYARRCALLAEIDRELQTGELKVLDVQGFPLLLRWYVVHRRTKRLPPVAQAFKDFLLNEGAALIARPRSCE